MNTKRSVGLLVVTALVSLGTLGVVSPAQALDTSWNCPTCLVGSTHR